MMGILSELISDPKGTLIFLLLALPGRFLAISAHEWGHAYAAYRCGDPTAKNAGRMTLNPIAHIDIVGFIMMLVAGFGWAKPVPVNPRNFRNYRRDDLKVSLAGITMNLILFAAGIIVMYAIAALALGRAAAADAGSAYYLMEYMGEKAFFVQEGFERSYIPMIILLEYPPYLGEFLIGTVFGDVVMYIYQMLMYFTRTNLVLAIFNLIPVPPLDGSHVLNDLVLYKFRRPLPYQVKQALYMLLVILTVNGTTGKMIGYVQDWVFGGIGAAAGALFGAMGLI